MRGGSCWPPPPNEEIQMLPSLQTIQTLLNEISFYAQLLTAILSLVAITYSLVRHTDAYYAFSEWFDISFLPTLYNLYFHSGLPLLFHVLYIDVLFSPGGLLEFFSFVSPVLTAQDEAAMVQAVDTKAPVTDLCLTKPLYVSGLVNTGNSCFLNSVLQVKKISALYNFFIVWCTVILMQFVVLITRPCPRQKHSNHS